MIPKDMRRRCERRLAKLKVPTPLNMAELRAEVSRHTGRPIEVRPVYMPSSKVCGLWLTIRGEDVIHVPAGTSVDHQGQVELHELSHILAGHTAEPAPDDLSGFAALAPDLDPALVERMMRRTTYKALVELEAELMATMIACAGTNWVPEPQRKVSDDDAAVVQRIDYDLSAWH